MTPPGMAARQAKFAHAVFAWMESMAGRQASACWSRTRFDGFGSQETFFTASSSPESPGRVSGTVNQSSRWEARSSTHSELSQRR